MTYNQKRLVAVALLLFVVLSAANYYLNLGILPRLAKFLVMFGVLMVLVYIFRFGPTREEMEEYRRKKKEGHR